MKRKKRGSALIFVVLTIAIIFTLSIGIMEITLASLRHSSSYYGKNQAFYIADTSLEKVLYYLDKFADEARKEANNYCFDESGAPNLEKDDIRLLYNQYTDGTIDENTYKEEIKKIFIREYKNAIIDFFEGNQEFDIFVERENINLTQKRWNDWKQHILSVLNNDTNIEVDFKLYNEAKNEEEYKKIIEGISEDKLLNHTKVDLTVSNPDLSYPKDTIILKVNIKNKNIKRYMIANFEFNPFGKELNKVSLIQKKIQKGYNKALDYGIIVGKNMFVANGDNNLNVNADVYVRGSGNDLDVNKSYEYFGGIIVGSNDSVISKLKQSTKDDNKTDLEDNYLGNVKGNLNIEGNVYIGGIENVATSGEPNYKLNSGFLRTVYENSNVNIQGNIYCHSIVTDEKGTNSNITITGSAYIADNLSLYASKSTVNVSNDLISFEEADDITKYNSSSSVVINNDTANITVGRNIVLFGTGFIEDLNDNNQNLYPTVETSAINPNFLIYNYRIDKFILPDGKELAWNTNDMDYLEYDMNNGDRIKMYNNQKNVEGNPTLDAEKGLNFLLQYLARSKYSDYYEQEYNRGRNITANNMNFTDDLNQQTSYFPYIFLANDKIQMFRDLSFIADNDNNKLLNIINDYLNKVDTNGAEAVKTNALNKVGEIKQNIIQKLSFRDKGKYNSNGFEDYFDIGNLEDIEFIREPQNGNRGTFIKVHKGDLIGTNSINLSNYNDYNFNDYDVLIFVDGDLEINNNSGTNINVYGNIIVTGDLIIKSGNGDITLNYNKATTKRLLNYFDSTRYDDCIKLYRLFAPGITADEINEKVVLSGFEERVKTNIDIKFKRQILTR